MITTLLTWGIPPFLRITYDLRMIGIPLFLIRSLISESLNKESFTIKRFLLLVDLFYESRLVEIVPIFDV